MFFPFKEYSHIVTVFAIIPIIRKQRKTFNTQRGEYLTLTEFEPVGNIVISY